MSCRRVFVDSPFHTIYAADLDRIESRGSHEQSLDALSAAFPDVAFWVDAGLHDAAEARSWLARHERAHLDLGSESLDDPAVLQELAADDGSFYRSTIAVTAFSDQKGFATRRICGLRA